MLLEYILYLSLGILLGTATGLIPGLHVNTITVLMLSLLPLFPDPLHLAVLLTAMATTHTFLDFIPSIFLGAPEEGTVLSVLPGHKLLLQGRGMEAVRITALASLYGVLFSLVLLAAAYFLIPLAYPLIRSVIAYVLIAAALLLLLRERSPERILWASFVFFISGLLGYVSLNHIASLSTHQIFFPLFSGLFGLSTLLFAITSGESHHPQDPGANIKLTRRDLAAHSLIGSLGGLLVGLLPAVSPSQIGIFFQELVNLKDKTNGKLEELHPRRFLTIIGSLNTADAIFSIFALYLIANPRSGVSVAIQDLFGTLDLPVFAALCATMLATGIIAYSIHLEMGRLFASFASRIDFRKLSAGVFISLILMIFALTGPLGILIAMVSLTIGLIPPLVGVSRTHTMGVLILPTILFFL